MEILEQSNEVHWLLICGIGICCIAMVVALNYGLYRLCRLSRGRALAEEERQERRRRIEYERRRLTNNPRKPQHNHEEERQRSNTNPINRTSELIQEKTGPREMAIRGGDLKNAGMGNQLQNSHISYVHGSSGAQVYRPDPLERVEKTSQEINPAQWKNAYSSAVQKSYWQVPLASQSPNSIEGFEKSSFVNRLDVSHVQPNFRVMPLGSCQATVPQPHDTGLEPGSIIDLQKELIEQFKKENNALKKQVDYYRQLAEHQASLGHFEAPHQVSGDANRVACLV